MNALHSLTRNWTQASKSALGVLATAGLVALSLAFPTSASGAVAPFSICHSTGASNNPYVVNHPAQTADVGGHDGHTGPIWSPGAVTWGDIIPPFNIVGGGFYPGLNWTAAGQAIYNNGCNIPSARVALPSITQASCNGGVITPPSYTLPTTTGLTYSGLPLSAVVVGGDTVVVTVTAAPGYQIIDPTIPAGSGFTWDAAAHTITWTFAANPPCANGQVALPTLTQSSCANNAATTASYVLPANNGNITYTATPASPVAGGTAVTMTATPAAGVTLVAPVLPAGSPFTWHSATGTLTWTFDAAPTNCVHVLAAVPTLTQAGCRGTTPTAPTFTAPVTGHVTYALTSGAPTAGAVGTMTATADAGYTLDLPANGGGFTWTQNSPTVGTATWTFAAALNCTPIVQPTNATAVAPSVTQSVCSNGAATVPSFTVPTTTGVIYTPATGGNGVAGTTTTVTAAPAPGYVLTGPTSFPVVFTAAPDCTVAVPDEDLGLSKTGPGTAKPGDVLTYTIKVTNLQGTPATNFVVGDTVPDGLSILTVDGAGFQCSIKGQAISCLYGPASLNVNDSVSITVTALLDANYAGATVTNAAVVDPGRPDVNPGNDTDSATTTVDHTLPFTGGGGGGATNPPPPPAKGGGIGLPFTGDYTQQLFQAGAGLLVLGLFLSLLARRRRSETE